MSGGGDDNGDTGALPSGERQAGERQGADGRAASGVDAGITHAVQEQLRENSDAQEAIGRILGQVITRYEAMRPHLNDPGSMALYERFLNGKITELHTILTDAKVSASAREKVLTAFRDDYDGIGAPPVNPGLAGVSVGGVDVDAVGWEPG